MPRSSGFWNLIAKKYTKDPVANEEVYQRKLEMTRALFSPEMHLLEIGCGSANTSILHAPFVAHIDAIDYASKMVEIAKNNVADANISNVSVALSTPQNWGPEKANYDMVLALSVLHLLPELTDVLAKVRSLMKTGGYFVSSTVLIQDESRLMRVVLPALSALRLIPYLKALDEPTLIKALETAGFQIETSWHPREKGSVFIIAKAI